MPLLLITPAAEPLVAPWRADHDWAAAFGIPAHVTVRTPFLPRHSWNENEIAPATRSFLPMTVRLSRLEDRPGALVVLVEPDDELRRLTAAIDAAWPALPPHKHGRSDAAYHVTVVRTPDAALRREAWEAIAPRLPLDVVGTELWAADGSKATGVDHAVVATAVRAG